MEAPQYPVGPFEPEEDYSPARRNEFISTIEAAPAKIHQAVQGLSEAQLNTLYKKWSIRQIVNHMADSHINYYVRAKWTLTEETPMVKDYTESLWVSLPDAQEGDLNPTLGLLDGLHPKLVQLLRSLAPEDYKRCFTHPEYPKPRSLEYVLGYYAWHCRHHTGQIDWLRKENGWS